MKSAIRVFRSPIPTFFVVLSYFLVTILVAHFAVKLYGRLQVVEKLLFLPENVETCFRRITQGYFSKVINLQNSQYLQVNFLNNTDNCFNQLKENWNKSKFLNSYNLDPLALSFFDYAFAMNELLKSNFDLSKYKVFNERYNETELKRDNLIENIETDLNWIFQVFKKESLFLFVILIFFTIYFLFKSLWERVTVRSEEEQIGETATINQFPVQTDIKQKNSKRQENNSTDAIDLSSLVMKIFALQKDKIFASGIRLNVKVQENIFVWAKSEALEIILLNLMANKIRAILLQSDAVKELWVQSRCYNRNIVSLTISHIHMSSKSVVENNVKNDLKVCQELMNECSGRFFSSRFRSQNHLNQIRIEDKFTIILRSMQTSKKMPRKRVKIFKGNKEQILSLLSHELQNERVNVTGPSF